MEPVIDHIQITVGDFAVAGAFYDRLMPLLGFDPKKRKSATISTHDFEVVDRWMVHGIIDLALDITVFPLQLIKMGCKRHDWFSLSWFPRLQPSIAGSGRAVLRPGISTIPIHHRAPRPPSPGPGQTRD